MSQTASASPHVRLAGAGLGVACAGHLLRQAGHRTVVHDAASRSGVPALLLSDAALALMADVFGQSDIVAGFPRITRRIVLWGSDTPSVMPHGGVVASQTDVQILVPPATVLAHDDARPAFTIHAGQPPVEAGPLMQFGHRMASACPILLTRQADRAAVYVEAVAQGWLFLIPAGGDGGWLLSVGGEADTLLGESRLIADQLAHLGKAGSRFETAPRLLPRLASDGWLALGSGALGFDPICGDGSAQSLREAILASAAIDAALARPEQTDDLLAHYQAMLLAAMRRHVQISANFYASGGTSPWWRDQLAATARGYEWCTRQLAACPEPRFMLRGFALHPRELAA